MGGSGAKPTIKIIAAGPAGGGKTSIRAFLVFRCAEQKVVNALEDQDRRASIAAGIQVDRIKYKKCDFDFWDLKSSDLKSWHVMYKGKHGIMFVVDSADKGGLKLAGKLLHKTLRDPHLTGLPVAICANKSDSFEKATLKEITDLMKLEVVTDRKWQIFATSTKDGDGLEAVLDWLYSTISPMLGKPASATGVLAVTVTPALKTSSSPKTSPAAAAAATPTPDQTSGSSSSATTAAPPAKAAAAAPSDSKV